MSDTTIDRSGSLEEFEQRVLNGEFDTQMSALLMGSLSATDSAITQKQNAIYEAQRAKIASTAMVKKMKDPLSMMFDIGSGIAQGVTAGLSCNVITQKIHGAPFANSTDLINQTTNNSRISSSIADIGKTGAGISGRLTNASVEEKRNEKDLLGEAKRTSEAALNRFNSEYDGLMQMMQSMIRTKHEGMQSIAR